MTVTAETLPIVFMLGTGRCGSSLLQEILARHPEAAFLSNVDDRLGSKGRSNRDIYAAVPAAWTQKGRVRFAPSEGYRLLDREVSPMISRASRDLTDVDVTPWIRRRLTRVFVERFAAQGGSVFLHKFTGWPRSGLLREVFPKARFIHVVRDGRAVANSLLQMSWWDGYRGPENWRLGPLPAEYQQLWEQHNKSFVVLAAIYWRILMEEYSAAERAIDNDHTWTTLRYEDLVEDPYTTLMGTINWLDLAWNSAYAGRVATQPFRKHRAQAFQSDLTSDQLAQAESVMLHELVRHGYDPSRTMPSTV